MDDFRVNQELQGCDERYTEKEMSKLGDRGAFPPLTLMFFLTFACGRIFAQGFLEDWPANHKKDLSKWVANTGLSFKFLDTLTKVATKAGDIEEEGYPMYIIENVDAKTLRKQKHILLSTWDYGTGHCMTLYVIKTNGSRFQKVWQSQENLCTTSMLGAAKSQALADGRIIVRFRDYDNSSRFNPEKDDAPRIVNVEVTYKWDGASYIKVGRNERAESRGTAR